MSLPISRFFIPTKQGKIYAGILAVIVILVSWIMTVNSLIYIDHYPCYEDAICMRLYESYYLFLYFAFLWYFILASFFVIFFGYEMRFMPLYVRNTSIGSLIVVILVTAIGYLILRKSAKSKSKKTLH